MPLLAIESAFLHKDSVKQQLYLQEIETLQAGVKNAQKSKFDKSLQLSTIVITSFAVFQMEEFKTTLTEEGIVWTNEDFFLKVLGWQKSFAYKMLKAGKLQAEKPEVVDGFKVKCNAAERAGETANRTIEGLLSFAKQLEQSNIVGGEGEEGDGDAEEPTVTRPKAVFTLAWKRDSGNVAVRIMPDGQFLSSNNEQEILDAIAFLQYAIDNYSENSAPIVPSTPIEDDNDSPF